MTHAFVIDERDNVGTLLEVCDEAQAIRLLGAASGTVRARGPIRAEHKIALTDITEQAAVVKYGMTIGRATCPIRAGDTVHLHNCASNYDERSNTLDAETGAPVDTPYV